METSAEQETLDRSLLDIREKLLHEDKQGVREAVLKLEEMVSPQAIMGRLAPLLFLPDESPRKFQVSHDVALSILSLLVSHNPTKYLEAASIAVREEAVRLSSAADEPMHVSTPLLNVIIQQLTSGMTGVSSQADQTLIVCCRKLGVEILGGAALRSLIDAWRQAWNGPAAVGSNNRAEASTICVRCASCIAEIATLGDDFMREAISSGAMTLLLQLLGDENDVLLEMASLDILEKLVMIRPMHTQRAQWLYSEAVLLPLLEMAGGTDETVADPVLGGPALRVLSQLCKLGHDDSQLFGRAGDYLLKGFHQALHNFDVSSEIDRLAIIDAISSFASASPDALNLVLDDPVTRQHWLNVGVAQPKLKAAILCSIAMVLDPAIEVDNNGDTVTNASIALLEENGSRRLYHTFGQVNNDEPTALILALARSPLPEIRIGAYTLLTAVAKIPSGPQILLGEAQFLEFLLSRPPIETTKEGREAKYGLVRTIYNSSVRGLLAQNIVQDLEKYLQQGPHYAETVSWELATE